MPGERTAAEATALFEIVSGKVFEQSLELLVEDENLLRAAPVPVIDRSPAKLW
jgi:hypothetical protein